MPELPGGTLTVLHTDVEESTPLTVHLGDRYPEVLAIHRTLLRAAVAAREGYEVDTQGDSFFVVFARATQAIAAAVAIQRALAAEAWPEGGAVRVRIGVHTGEPIRTAEGYTGLDVIRGARIKEAGHGGQVLLSKSTAALIEDALIGGLSLRDLGARITQMIARGISSRLAGLRHEIADVNLYSSRRGNGVSDADSGANADHAGCGRGPRRR